MFVFKLLAIVLMFILLVPVSMDISEKFTNIDPHLGYDKNIKNYIDSNILEHSIKTCNKELETKLNTSLCQKKSLYDTIKYMEGVKWSAWLLPTHQLDDVCYQMYNHIREKLKADVLYFKLKKIKQNLDKTKELLLNFEFVFYKKSSTYAYHASCVSVHNLEHNSFIILTVKILGNISEDKIHMHNNKPINRNQEIKTDVKYTPSLVMEDAYEAMTTHDEQVENILYDRLMIEHEPDDDYWKNVEYINNQNLVRDMFLKDKKSNSRPISHCYKNYPYTNDFTISLS